jgi:hypothetical protein
LLNYRLVIGHGDSFTPKIFFPGSIPFRWPLDNRLQLTGPRCAQIDLW